jgi:AraC family transcriptional regulator
MRMRKRDHSELVARVKDMLAQASGLKVSLGDLARAVGSSPSHLAAIFKKAEHTTIHRYLVDLRLRRAASLLWGCDDLTTLALNLGFASQSHFSNAFRRWAGCPPGQYRARLRALGVLYGKAEESFG